MAAVPAATLVTCRSLPASPTDTVLARLVFEPAPSATLLAPEAVLLLPIATAFVPEAVALPSTTQLSTMLLLSTRQLALPPTSTDCA